MLCTFSFGCFQIYQNKSAKNIAVHFIGTIVSIKCMPKISAVRLFCLDKFENNQTRTCTTFFQTSNLTEVYFNRQLRSEIGPILDWDLPVLSMWWLDRDFPKLCTSTQLCGLSLPHNYHLVGLVLLRVVLQRKKKKKSFWVFYGVHSLGWVHQFLTSIMSYI